MVSTSYSLLKTIGKGLVQCLLRVAARASGVGIAAELALEVWEQVKHEHNLKQLRDELEALAHSPESARQHVEAVAEEVAGNQSQEVQQIVRTYLQELPGQIQRTTSLRWESFGASS